MCISGVCYILHFRVVIPAGIEPTASEPESEILSIKLRDLYRAQI